MMIFCFSTNSVNILSLFLTKIQKSLVTFIIANNPLPGFHLNHAHVCLGSEKWLLLRIGELTVLFAGSLVRTGDVHSMDGETFYACTGNLFGIIYTRVLFDKIRAAVL